MVFGGRASAELAARIATHLGVDLGAVDLRTFSDGEVYCRYEESIRGADVFLVQSTAANEQTGMTPNDALMELLVMIDAAKGASAHRIIAVVPWYGYSRQDKKSSPREPISSRVVAKCLEEIGVDRILTMDLHAGQIQGFFNIPVDHLFANPVIIEYLGKKGLRDPVVVSPDAGGVERARAIAKRLQAGLAIIDKRREGPNQALAMYLIGDVRGKDAVVIDDMIDTAGTLLQAVGAVAREGARRILACGVHPVLSGPAIERIKASALEETVVTNSIPVPPDKQQAARLTVLTVAPLLGEAIRRIHDEESVSTLFV
jgi:ribose-phosphate pyrophosphokinase